MKNSTRAWIGLVAWLAFAASARTSPTGEPWTHVLLLFAALVLIPLAFDLVVERRDSGQIARAMTWAQLLQLPAAACLAVACGLRPGLLALVLALPWAFITTLLASVGMARLARDTWARPIERLSADVGLGYLVIGGIGLLIDRSGLQPLHLSAPVIALTAAHFHFAGFLLPLFAGRVARANRDSRLASRGVVGVILGVPAVALGITFSQLGWTPAIEAAAGCGLALAGAVVAILHVRWALDAADQPSATRGLILVCGVSLFFAMLLAAAYAVRPYSAPLPWLGLPQMRALHGTLNAFGVGLCGVLGWRAADANLRSQI
jgi:hypothetical protein